MLALHTYWYYAFRPLLRIAQFLPASWPVQWSSGEVTSKFFPLLPPLVADDIPYPHYSACLLLWQSQFPPLTQFPVTLKYYNEYLKFPVHFYLRQGSVHHWMWFFLYIFKFCKIIVEVQEQNFVNSTMNILDFSLTFILSHQVPNKAFTSTSVFQAT